MASEFRKLARFELGPECRSKLARFSMFTQQKDTATKSEYALCTEAHATTGGPQVEKAQSLRRGSNQKESIEQ